MNGKRNRRKIQRTRIIIIMIHGVCNPVSFNFHITQFLCQCYYSILTYFCYSSEFICTNIRFVFSSSWFQHRNFLHNMHHFERVNGFYHCVCVCVPFFFHSIHHSIRTFNEWKYEGPTKNSEQQVYRFAANQILLDACISESMCFVGVSICIIVFFLSFFPFSCCLFRYLVAFYSPFASIFFTL